MTAWAALQPVRAKSLNNDLGILAGWSSTLAKTR